MFAKVHHADTTNDTTFVVDTPSMSLTASPFIISIHSLHFRHPMLYVTVGMDSIYGKIWQRPIADPLTFSKDIVNTKKVWKFGYYESFYY